MQFFIIAAGIEEQKLTIRFFLTSNGKKLLEDHFGVRIEEHRSFGIILTMIQDLVGFCLFHPLYIHNALFKVDIGCFKSGGDKHRNGQIQLIRVIKSIAYNGDRFRLAEGQLLFLLVTLQKYLFTDHLAFPEL